MKFILSAIIFFWAGTSHAELLRYVDELGRTHYVDSADKIPEAHRSGSSNGIKNGVSRVTSGVDLPKRKQVNIFVTGWCRYCRQLETFLKEHNISYTRYDVEKDAIGRKRYLELGRSGVPIVEIDGRVMRGFDEDTFSKALGID